MIQRLHPLAKPTPEWLTAHKQESPEDTAQPAGSSTGWTRSFPGGASVGLTLFQVAQLPPASSRQLGRPQNLCSFYYLL